MNLNRETALLTNCTSFSKAFLEIPPVSLKET
jgi:hypothetical protein